MARAGLFDAIREAALDPEAWNRVQSESESFFGAFASQLASVDHRNGNAFFSRTTQIPEIDDYMVEAGPRCEPVVYAAGRPRWRHFSDYDYIDEKGMDRSDFYRDVERFNIRYRLALRLVDTPGLSKAMLWCWPAGRGPVGPEDYAKLRTIEHELRLAAHVSESLGRSLEVERGIVDALEATSTPALIADPGGTAVVMNARAERLFDSNDGIGLGSGRNLWVKNKAAAARLAGELAKAGKALFAEEAVRYPHAVAIPRPSGRAPYGALVTPLSLRHQFLGRARPLVLVILKDPVEPSRPRAAVLGAVFGLSPAETDVALLFSEGHSLSDIADRRQASVATVRNQVKATMGKIGVGRQAELMRVLNGFSDIG